MMSENFKIPEVKAADIVIFGGLGDLALRKIFPAIYYRCKSGQIDSESRVIIISRGVLIQSEFKTLLKEKLTTSIKDYDPNTINKLLKMSVYLKADLTKKSSLSDLKNHLRVDLNIIRVFYLSVSSSIFGSITKNLHLENLITKNSRVVLEKPLGHDSKSSRIINSEISEYFDENQIFRIDHYLGKETVQNLMVLRFANNLYENAWDSQNIENVQITVSEELGVSTRGNYYDKYGALLDMVQNHLLQLLCLVAMEPPSVLHADNVRDEKLKVLNALRLFDDKMVLNQTVKGQYTRGKIKGDSVLSYLEDINQFTSETETFVAIRANVDNWRWAGVPFYLRTGKRLAKRYSEIVINFKNVPHNIFPDEKPIINNKLIISLQPEERIELVQTVKIPGPGGYRYKPKSLVLDYSSSFNEPFPDAYERLLIDVIRGNQTLFMRKDEVEASWVWIDSIKQHWKTTKMENSLYNSGSSVPKGNVLIDGHTWNE